LIPFFSTINHQPSTRIKNGGDRMARITIEDCLKRTPNRFVLVNMAARRVRQIREGSEYLVNSAKNEDIVVALREIAAGKVTLKDDPGIEL
jgi:DNA-directed RNA polymerase subunit omega